MLSIMVLTKEHPTSFFRPDHLISTSCSRENYAKAYFRFITFLAASTISLAVSPYFSIS